MASTINKYAPNIARARYKTTGGTSSVPVSGRHAPTIDTGLFSGKPAAGKPAAGDSGSGGLASRIIEKISSGGKGAGGESLPAPEYNPVVDAERGEDPNSTSPSVETQQPIEARGSSARYMIQGNGPKIDLSFLVPARANKAFDPSKAIGGENVPFKESKGVGGLLRRFLGDESNAQNIAAQQVQGAEWKQNAHEQLVEDRALAKMAAADAPMQKRFETTQAENKIIREAEAATRLLERGDDASTRKGERFDDATTRAGERKDDKAERLARETAAEKTRLQEREDKLGQQLIDNADRADRFSLASRPNFQAVSNGDGVLLFDPTTGKPSGTFSKPTLKEVKDPITGKKEWKNSGGGYESYVPPVKAPVKDGSPGVDRATGATLGGPLPPGDGVRLGGALPAPVPAVVTQPRSATIADHLVNLPGMGAVLDMPRWMTSERTARLDESKKLQQIEGLKRTRAMQEQAYGDLGPSAF